MNIIHHGFMILLVLIIIAIIYYRYFGCVLAASRDYLCESMAKGRVNTTKEFKPADTWAGPWEGYFFGIDEKTGMNGYILDQRCLPLLVSL